MKIPFGLLVILFLASCSPVAPQAGQPATLPPQPTDALESTATVDMDTEVVTMDKNEIVITLHRSGGLAGISENWVIYSDGRIESDTGQSYQSTSSEVAELAKEIEGLGFYDLGDSYLPKDPCCDRISFVLTVVVDGRSKTIRTTDGIPGNPENLMESLRMVASFISEQ